MGRKQPNVEHDRRRKPSTIRDYRSVVDNHPLPAFAAERLEDLMFDRLERWAMTLGTDRAMSNRQKAKVITILHGVMARACRIWRLPANSAAGLEKPRPAPSAGIDVFAPEEVLALVRAAEDEQDAAIFLTAAFTGLRQGELLALRWRDADFAGPVIRVTGSYTNGQLTTPKSGRARAVPLAPQVAEALARLGQRGAGTGGEDLVFVGLLGGYLNASALLRRYKAALAALRRAGLRPLRFHDLRHTFGTTMIARADILRVKEWMRHAHVDWTMQYLHYAPRSQDAARSSPTHSPSTPCQRLRAARGSRCVVLGVGSVSCPEGGARAPSHESPDSRPTLVERSCSAGASMRSRDDLVIVGEQASQARLPTRSHEAKAAVAERGFAG